MKREQIEQWAREADCTHVNVLGDQSKALERLERFAALAAAHEREQIAAHYGAQPHVEHFGSNIADEIRARGEVTPSR